MYKPAIRVGRSTTVSRQRVASQQTSIISTHSETHHLQSLCKCCAGPRPPERLSLSLSFLVNSSSSSSSSSGSTQHACVSAGGKYATNLSSHVKNSPGG